MREHKGVTVDTEHVHDLDADPEPEPVASRLRRSILADLTVALGVATIIGLVVLWPGPHSITVPAQFRPFGASSATVVTGSIDSVQRIPCTSTDSAERGHCAHAKVKLDADGSLAEISLGGPTGAPVVEVGTPVRLVRTIDPQTGEPIYAFDDFRRGVPLGVLAAVFAVVVVLVGRWRGVGALGALVVAYAVLVFFLLPALLVGEPALLVGLVAACAVAFR